MHGDNVNTKLVLIIINIDNIYDTLGISNTTHTI